MSLLAMLAVRAAAVAGGGHGDAVMRPERLPQLKIWPGHLALAAIVYQSTRGHVLEQVTMGRAGIVLGIEMSRLARTGKDWHHLLGLCSLSGTLLAGPDAVYDPGYYNDRLLLGLSAPA